MPNDETNRPEQPPPPPEAVADAEPSGDPGEAASPPRKKILIGSQRDPDAYKPKPKRDWVSPKKRDKGKGKGSGRPPEDEQPAPPASPEPPTTPRVEPPEPVVVVATLPMNTLPGLGVSPPEFRAQSLVAPLAPLSAAELPTEVAAAPAPLETEEIAAEAVDAAGVDAALAMPPVLSPGARRFPPPNLRDRLPPDLEQEFEAAVAEVSLDTLIAGSEAIAAQAVLEPESRHVARVVAVGREDVFVELGGREQGIVPLKMFPEPPQPGTEMEVVVTRFNPEEGLYEVTLPMAAAEIADWSQVYEGMVVEARVTGHNTGGLECEVNHIRAFIPVSQIALYRVENLEEFVGQKFTCLVTEADRERRNLVLSRRAVLEREREEARRVMLESLAPGQILEGVVRKVLDFGAFVELGSGVDGLLHVSQLGWGRVKHPRDVVQEGQKIRVRVDRVDTTTGKISLSYKDLLENPWTDADRKFPPNSTVKGKVVKLMEFGAFVELEPGVEGLVHISELSHKRVARVSDVVKEGDEIDLVVLSVDPGARRISLSLKAATLAAEPEGPPAKPAADEPAAKPKPSKRPARPLQGGLGRSPGGPKFGLKW